ncbi:hypothetical protein TorRG33x02_168630 [Trema orientale]|uniref:Uncharacterized protein n=1 Tax=Trema orientale TaxID=63057 RepID=A0A2P5EP73_TREOI|nr:hypothetical protein TorRG33x02_168630 [Trema orientale]
MENGFLVKEVEVDSFLFSFGHDVEWDMVQEGEPRHFNCSLLVLKKSMNETVGMLLGNKLGSPIEVEKDDNGSCLGRFLRVQDWSYGTRLYSEGDS